MTPGRPLRPGRMRAALARLRAATPPPGPPVPDDHPGTVRRGAALLVSLVVAMVLWFTFSMRGTYVLSVRAPVTVAALPEGQALASTPPDQVTVQLQGEGWNLLGLTRRPPTIRLFADEPTVDVLAAVNDAGLPSGVTAQSVQPRTLALDLDRRVVRELPIRLVRRIETEPTRDLLRAPRLDPAVVRVSGAASLLRGLADWPTETLSRTDVQESFTAVVALDDTLDALVTRSPRVVTVTVDVGEFTTETASLPVEVTGLPDDVERVRLIPDRVTASFRAPLAQDVDALDGFVALVDYADIARDTTSGSVPVSVRIPRSLDVRDVSLSPGRLEYFIVRSRPPQGPVDR